MVDDNRCLSFNFPCEYAYLISTQTVVILREVMPEHITELTMGQI